MICYKCNGTGYYDIYNECPVCDGTGEYEPFDADIELDKLYPTEQTNDEWRKICSAEEFAEFLFGIAYMCSYCGDEAHSTKEKIQKCHFGKCVCQRQDWEEWLKQPHATKE
jgi:RecJ-like exonuclease